MINDKGTPIVSLKKFPQDFSPERVAEIEKFFTANPFSPQIARKRNSSEIWEVENIYKLSNDRCKIILENLDTTLKKNAWRVDWMNQSLTSAVMLE